MSQEDKKETGAASQDHKLDAIKQIIFGEQIREYEEEFKSLKEGIASQRKELEDELQDLKQEAEKQLAAFREDFKKALEAFKEEAYGQLKELESSKTDKAALGDMLEELGRKLKSQ